MVKETQKAVTHMGSTYFAATQIAGRLPSFITRPEE